MNTKISTPEEFAKAACDPACCWGCEAAVAKAIAERDAAIREQCREELKSIHAHCNVAKEPR